MARPDAVGIPRGRTEPLHFRRAGDDRRQEFVKLSDPAIQGQEFRRQARATLRQTIPFLTQSASVNAPAGGWFQRIGSDFPPQLHDLPPRNVGANKTSLTSNPKLRVSKQGDLVSRTIAARTGFRRNPAKIDSPRDLTQLGCCCLRERKQPLCPMAQPSELGSGQLVLQRDQGSANGDEGIPGVTPLLLNFAARPQDTPDFLLVIRQIRAREHLTNSIERVGIVSAKRLKLQRPPVCRNNLQGRAIIFRKKASQRRPRSLPRLDAHSLISRRTYAQISSKGSIPRDLE